MGRAAAGADKVDRSSGHVPFVRLRGLAKRYDAVVAVAEASFDIHAGEVLGLVGENGAGKSTLISLVSGAQPPDAGTIEVGPVAHRSLTPAGARDAGIVAIRQEPVLVPTLSVAENLLLGREPSRRGIVSRGATARTARDWLARVGAAVPPDALVATLSPADRQLVEIARAVGPGARLLFFDEPTAALGPAETERLYGLIRRLAEEGTAVVYVSHRLEEVFAVCQRVVVMRDARVVADEPIGALDEPRLVALMAGRELAADLASPHVQGLRPSAAPRLVLDGIGVGGRLVDASLTIAPGEVHGIAGIVGAGRTTLAETIAGVVRPTSGTMRLDDRPYAPGGPREALDAGVVLVPEDRLRDGLFPELSIATNTTLPRADRVSRRGVIGPGAEAAASKPLLERLRVRPSRPSALARALSGGNQQKVVLARALFAEPRVLVLDEPTRGIDVGTKLDIHELIRELAVGGVAVLVVSSDLRELLALADRVTVLARGRVTGSFGAPLDGHRIMAAATGAAA
jgi:ABC-type sugar transport system ATPase subunit